MKAPMNKKKAPKKDSLPPLPTELWWGRSTDNPRSKLIQERSWPKVVSYKLAQGESHPPGGQPWYHTAPQRLFDRIERETLLVWRRLLAATLWAARKENPRSIVKQCLMRVKSLIHQGYAYASVDELFETISHCRGDLPSDLRARALDCQKIFNRIENLRLALALHNDAISRLSESPTDLGECKRKMTEALAWFVVEGYNLGSLARLVGLRPLEDEVLQVREHKRIGGNNSGEVRLQASAPARREAIRLAASYKGSKASLVSHVTRTLENNGHTHLQAGEWIPYSKDTVRDWLKEAGQL